MSIALVAADTTPIMSRVGRLLPFRQTTLTKHGAISETPLIRLPSAKRYFDTYQRCLPDDAAPNKPSAAPGRLWPVPDQANVKPPGPRMQFTVCRPRRPP